MRIISKMEITSIRFLVKVFFIFISLYVNLSNQTFSQEKSLFDSLEKSIKTEKSNTKKLKLLLNLGSIAAEKDAQKAIEYGNEALVLSETSNLLYGKAIGNLILAKTYNYNGNSYRALDHYQKSLAVCEIIKDSTLILDNLDGLFYIFWNTKDFKSAREIVDRRFLFSQKKGLEIGLSNCYNHYALIFESEQKNDSAIIMYHKSGDIIKTLNNSKLLARYYNNLGIIHQVNLKKPQEALVYQLKAEELLGQFKDNWLECFIYICLSKTYIDLNELDKAFEYLSKGYKMAKEFNSVYSLQESYNTFYFYYKKKNDYSNSLKYLELSEQLKDSLFDNENLNKLANLRIEIEAERNNKLIEQKKEEIKAKNKLIVNFLIVILFGGVAGFLLYNSREEKKKINKVLESKNIELINKNDEIRSQNETLEEQHEEIQAQANQLAQINNEINKINESLEIKVKERTLVLEEQNKKLLEYNFMNSHVLRSPVARLKGLFNIIEMEPDLNKKLEYIDLFKQSVEDLDNFTKNVSAKLNEGMKEIDSDKIV